MAKAPVRKPKKKVCLFCQEKISYVDYKDTALLRKFISDRGKIRARRVTGNCTQHQRDVGLAMRWSRGAEKQIELIKRARSVREIRGLGDARQVAGQLAGLRVRLETKAGDSGRLFGSVSAADIAAAVRAAGGPELDRRRIEIRSPIKTVGEHQIAVRLHPEVSATLDVEVVGA